MLARLARHILGYLLAARSRHGHFAGYHRHFQHENAILTCPCAEEKFPNNIFYYYLGYYYTQLYRAHNSNASVSKALASAEGMYAVKS